MDIKNQPVRDDTHGFLRRHFLAWNAKGGLPCSNVLYAPPLRLPFLSLFSVPAFAGSHHKIRVRGTVESVDPAQKTFVVKDRDGKAIPFRVDDRSEFELEHRDKPDQDVPFTELKTGDRVKVKAFKGEPPHLVDDVDIYR